MNANAITTARFILNYCGKCSKNGALRIRWEYNSWHGTSRLHYGKLVSDAAT